MGELLDPLNEIDSRPHAPGEPIKSLADQFLGAFHFAGKRVNETIEAAQEPGMTLDKLSRWTRQAPLQALAGVHGRCARDPAPTVEWRPPIDTENPKFPTL